MSLIKYVRGKSDRSAFTLIELLTVITILAILMAMTIAIISYAQGKAAEEKTKIALAAIESGLARYYDHNGEYPEPMDNDGSTISGAVAIYQALMDDGDDEIVGGPNTPSDGRSGGEILVDLKSDGWTAQDGEGGAYYVKDGYDRPFYYMVFDPKNPEATKQKTYDLWSYGYDKDKNEVNEAQWVKNW